VLGGLKLAVSVGRVFTHPLHGVSVVMLGHPYPRNILRHQLPMRRPLSCVREWVLSGRLYSRAIIASV
jgi:hypothetical protein